jgi:hypothetical protein
MAWKTRIKTQATIWGGLSAFIMIAPARAHCHIFKIWHYRFPQHCAVMKPRVLVHGTSHEQISIPLPSLDWIECQPGDERMLGIARLREMQ